MSQQAMVPPVATRWPNTAFVKTTAITLLTIPLGGCSSSPEFNILGSYFPSWIVCLAIAAALTFAVHVVITERRVAGQLWPLSLVYTSLICFLSCTLWIIFFE
jgi:drug/metabolite transporter (DMT)-like permease